MAILLTKQYLDNTDKNRKKKLSVGPIKYKQETEDMVKSISIKKGNVVIG